MRYEKIIKGIFKDRPNRFIAHVEINGKIETVHVKNTGRCKELLIPGCTVILEDFRNRSGYENRKTKFDLVAVYKDLDQDHPLYRTHNFLLINMDSQAPNKVVAEWLALQDYDFVKPEFTYGNSRVDFYMKKKNPATEKQKTVPCQKFLMEVKGCTLEKNGIGYFPDAPTERGVKHLRELASASKLGIRCFLAFVIQIPEIKEVLPNLETHPEFGQALEEAKKAGVEVLFLQCSVNEDELKIV